MEITELLATLTDGLSAEDAAAVRRAVERDAVKNKAAGWKQQSEFDAVNTRLNALQAELEGTGAAPGTRAYAKWYKDHEAELRQVYADKDAYEKKYGKLDGSGAPPPQNPNQPGARMYTEAEMAELVDKRIQEKYAPQWSNTFVVRDKIMQKHFLAGRKNPIDIDALAKLANEKYSGNLELAYDEIDAPEREKERTAAEDARVQKRVDEELAKRGANRHFPAAADFSPSPMSTRSKADLEKFDKTSLMQDMAREWDPSVV